MDPLIVEAVEAKKGLAEDNLTRAKLAFRGLSADELARAHGESGRSRLEVLSEYQAEYDKWEKCLAEVQK